MSTLYGENVQIAPSREPLLPTATSSELSAVRPVIPESANVATATSTNVHVWPSVEVATVAWLFGTSTPTAVYWPSASTI